MSILNSPGFRGPVQIMRQTISNNDISKPSYASYHRYKGLSSMWGLARYIKDISDIKPLYIQTLYGDMLDIRFDMKV